LLATRNAHRPLVCGHNGPRDTRVVRQRSDFAPKAMLRKMCGSTKLEKSPAELHRAELVRMSPVKRYARRAYMKGILLFKRLAKPWSSFFMSVPTSSVFCIVRVDATSSNSSNLRWLLSSRSAALRV